MACFPPFPSHIIGSFATPRRDAGVVERDGLENRCALTGTVGSNPTLSAKISMRINEMDLMGHENPQLPRSFADRDRTSETAENAKIGL